MDTDVLVCSLTLHKPLTLLRNVELAAHTIYGPGKVLCKAKM